MSSQQQASSTDRREDHIAARLLDPNLDIAAKIKIATDLRDSVDSLYQREQDYRAFADVLLPVIIKFLEKGKPSLNSQTPEHKLRHNLLETLQRLHHSEPIRPHAVSFMALMIRLLRVENEENAVICVKIIIDLHRSYKDILASTAEDFTTAVKEIYNNMEEVVSEVFEDAEGEEDESANTPSTPGNASTTAAMTSTQQGGPLPLGMKSFKVLTECPIAIVFLFQNYKSLVMKEVNLFIPQIFNFLALEPAAQARAHEQAKERGENFVGVCPAVNKKRQQFNDFLVAQVKTMSFLAYVLRVATAALQPYKPVIPEVTVRLMKDCPPEASTNRKELLVATRHILSSEFRLAFVPHVDTLLDERVLIGKGITCHETLRPLAYSMVADLLHHVRGELNSDQLARIVHAYTCNLHDPTLAPSIQTMCSKLLLNLIESILQKETKESIVLLNRILEAFVAKVTSMADVVDDWSRWSRPLSEQHHNNNNNSNNNNNKKSESSEKNEQSEKSEKSEDNNTSSSPSPSSSSPSSTFDEVDMERSKPVRQMHPMVDPQTEPFKDLRYLFRNLIFGVKTVLTALKHIQGPTPTPSVMGRLFEGGIKCLSMYDARTGAESKECMDAFAMVFIHIDHCTFEEVFETRLPSFFDQVQKNNDLLGIPHYILSNESVSQIFVSILFRFLISRLEVLGTTDKDHAHILLRMFKMAFMAVTIFPETNEVALQPHVSHIIMQSLKLASKSQEPTFYYVLLRALFRSIGGGRFELLYTEVLPLLQTLLETLNNLLNTATSSKRELFVELCLTVPVRLSVLLPYLNYLMKPLVLALQAGPDLVSQGLRTLELCVDNLTQEFLSPLMAPVIHEVMEALWKLLKPIPYNHHHAHTAMRILGKFGGRNRKLLGPSRLEWQQVGPEAELPLTFDGKAEPISLKPLIELAGRMIRRNDVHYRNNAHEFLKHSIVVLLKEDLPAGEPEEVTVNVLKGLMDAALVDGFMPDALDYIRLISRYIVSIETSRTTDFPEVSAASSQKKQAPLLPICQALVTTITEHLATVELTELNKAANHVELILKDLVEEYGFESGITGPARERAHVFLTSFTQQMCSLCYDPPWQRKTGGATGLEILVKRLTLPNICIEEHEAPMVRALFFMLKDMPTDPPGNVDDVSELILFVLQRCNPPKSAKDDRSKSQQKVNYFVKTLAVELASQVKTARDTAKKVLDILASARDLSVPELLRPHRDLLLVPIFNKPLRALAFPMQIGNIDAITYCISTRPPLIDFAGDTPSEDPREQSYETSLNRLLTEALGIADAEDSALTGKSNQHRNIALLTNLRVVCVRLLTAAMGSSGFSATAHTSHRMKIISTCFKLLYARSPEVVDAAFENLKQILAINGRLPKDLLQQGLRPVLMNLSDSRKITSSSLAGLARLLGLLTNYFKVEIGTKLVEHFNYLAEPAKLQRAVISPQRENSEIEVITALVNIFHLLPYNGSGIYLDELCQYVISVEKVLKKDSAGPCTDELAAFLDLYPAEAAKYFFGRINDEDSISTFKHVLGSKKAGKVREYIDNHFDELFRPCFAESIPLPGSINAARLIQQLVHLDSNWFNDKLDIIEILKTRWVSAIRRDRLSKHGQPHLLQIKEDEIVLDIFMVYLRQAEYVDLLYHVVDVFTTKSPVGYANLLKFFYEHVITSHDVPFKERVIIRFLDIFENENVTQAHKTAALHFIVNPILAMSFSRGSSESELAGADFITDVHAKLWLPSQKDSWVEARYSDEELKIELLTMSTLLVPNRHHLIGDRRKDVIKFAWVNIKNEDVMVKQAAHNLAAHFLAKFGAPRSADTQGASRSNIVVAKLYLALLRAYQSEAKSLVRDALDTLTPSLPRTYANEQDSLQWLKMTRTVLIQDGYSNVQQMVHVFHLIVRHGDLFYPRRDLFIPHIVSVLPKLALVHTATPETRQLAIDLIELLIGWERKRIEAESETSATEAEGDKSAAGDNDEEGTEDAKPRSPKRQRVSRSGASATPSSSGATGGGGGSGQSQQQSAYVIPTYLKDNIYTMMIRMLAHSTEPIHRVPVLTRALNTLKSVLDPKLWGDMNIKVNFFQRTLSQMDVNDSTATVFCNTIDTLRVAISNKDDTWFKANIQVLQRIVSKCLQSTDDKISSSLAPVLDQIFQSIPIATEGQESSEDVRSFLDWANTAVSEGLREMNNLNSSMTLLYSWVKADHSKVDYFAHPITRVLGKATKEHINSSDKVHTGSPEYRLLGITIDVLCVRVSYLGEHRRWLLSALVQLVEKSPNIEMCRKVLDIVTRWIREKESLPTIKEKAALLLKMTSFENRTSDEAILHEYLDLILSIYTDPAYTRSELTVRLEQAFLLGCRNRDANVRDRFLQVFDQSITRKLFQRMHYILGVQNWESLGETNWMHQALDLLLGAADTEVVLFKDKIDSRKKFSNFDDFLEQVNTLRSGGLLAAARKLLYADALCTQTVWISTFKAAWSCLNRKEQSDMAHFIISLLTKEYHLKNLDRRPNVIQALLSGLLACQPPPALPPYLVRYLGKTFNAWHIAIELLNETIEDHREPESVTSAAVDALAETYSELSEEDYYWGLWNRRSLYSETSTAISFEQCGAWQQAQVMYEAAQVKARQGAIPFTESEYTIWEDHWVICAQKLQQWDILTDLAKHEGNADLALECAWRLGDWSQDRENIEQAIANMSPVPTPRKKTFDAFMALVKSDHSEERKSEFQKICDEGIQISLRKWYYLPEIVSQSHIPLFQVFQQWVELFEASQIFNSLALTNTNNFDQRSQELKNILQTWRERLPNVQDDVNIWSDLVAWRQHIFSAINKAYLPLLPQNGSNSTANSYVYRGYHETAWIINRFAHVARKHNLHDVCVSSLTKIYTLPNIEIQEAFLKLREQAKCHYKVMSELGQGLEVINNTNLMYFGSSQKAEFFTLKGMFLDKLGLREDANTVFQQAVTIELNFPKAWAEWGKYSDRMFKANPSDKALAANAVGCYLQAAGLYKNAKVRKLLIRILWLLSLDDANGVITRAFDSYKGELPVWYWITFIPQLLVALSNPETKHTRLILMKIARGYPQALFFHLRTQSEDYRLLRRQQEATRQRQAAAAASSSQGSNNTDNSTQQNSSNQGSDKGSSQGQQQNASNPNTPQQQQQQPKQPWELVDEIFSVLKTAFPLLALTLENMCDQFSTRFKPTADEDVFRLVNALLNDGLQQYINRAPLPDDDGKLPSLTVSNVTRFAENLHKGELKDQFEADFVTSKPDLETYVHRLQAWRDRYEKILDRKAKRQNLENTSHWLVEFQYYKFDEIEVPGQYLKLEDNNHNFVRIRHFEHKFDMGRIGGSCTRRIQIHGHDGSLHCFGVQLPAARHCRREERIMQLFRMLNGPLAKKKESRKRNLQFRIPLAVPLTPHLRLLEMDLSIISLQDIYEQYCREIGIGKDDAILMFPEKLRELSRARKEGFDSNAAKLEIFEEIGIKLLPDDILKNYMTKSIPSPSHFWYFRKQITLQLASVIFMTYIMSMGGRYPARIFMSREKATLHTSEMIPSFSGSRPEFVIPEPVPFRFTPNIQKFITPVGTEGVLTSAIMAIAQALTESEFDLEHRLSIFVREEVSAWHSLHQRTPPDGALREFTIRNIENVVQRAKIMACKMEREKQPVGSMPANLSVVELLSTATNPQRLALMDPVLLPWL